MRKVFFLLLFFYVDLVQAQAPEGYYTGTEALTGEELKTALYNIIKDHTEYPYTSSGTDTWDILKEADRDPNNPDNVIGIYSGFSIPADPEYNNGDGWTREHVWAKSRGDFGTDMGAGTDVHHLRAEDNSTNTARSNRNFAEAGEAFVDDEGTYQGATGSFTSSSEFIWEPRAEVKGDVARMIFYMATRYEGEGDEPDLELVNYMLDQSAKDPVHGRLYDLLVWHKQDPVDDSEQNRNDVIYSYQGNRNPFIDHPEWVAEIWGDNTDPALNFYKSGFNHDFGAVSFGASMVQNYTINTYYLTDNLTVAVPPPFYVSTDNESFSNEITLSIDENEWVQSFEVFLKFEPQQADGTAYSSTVSHTSTGLETVAFTVEGKEGEPSVISIADARNKSLGTVVTVSGVVIDMGNNSSRSRIIYDGTAGIVVRSPQGEANETGELVYGDSVVVSGGLSEYGEVLQIEQAPFFVDLIKQDATVPEPQEVTISQIGESYESELVTIRNVSFDDAGITFMGGGADGNFTITDETGSLTFRIGSSLHPLVGETVPSGKYDITGFVGQFYEDYQISPRMSDDLEVIGNSLGIKDAESLPDLVYPNPAVDFIYLQLPKNQSSSVLTVKILDVSGRLMKEEQINNLKIDISDLNSGTFILVVTMQDVTYYNRFIKK